MADAAVAQTKEPGNADAEPGTASNSKENTAPAEVEDESDSKLLVPLANGNYRKILKELPDGPRIAAETCVQFWKVWPSPASLSILRRIVAHGSFSMRTWRVTRSLILTAVNQKLACPVLLDDVCFSYASRYEVLTRGWCECVQDKKLPTEELVAFLKTISVHRFCITSVSFLLLQVPGREDRE